MTTVMLATYPEVFAAGAVIAGLPFGIAGNVREALSGMRASPPRSSRKLGDLVRKATPHKGPWPRLSVWHGSADRVVHPGNSNEIVKQWLDLHHLPAAPMSEGVVDGHPRQVWWDADGETVVESYSITDMAHGTPLGIADNDQRYGAQGAFMIEAGISSSYRIAEILRPDQLDPSAQGCAVEAGCAGIAKRQFDPDGFSDGGRAVRADAGPLQGAVAVDDDGAASGAAETGTSPPQHRCQRGDHARAHRRRTDEIGQPRAKAR